VLDLTLAATDRAYLMALTTYMRALAERNSLLKRGTSSPGELAAFEQILAPAGAQLIAARTAGLRLLAESLTAAYARISDAAEPAGFSYAPDLPSRPSRRWPQCSRKTGCATPSSEAPSTATSRRF